MNRTSFLILAAVLVLGAGGYTYFNQPQPTIQSSIPLAMVTVPELSASEREGEVAYNQSCASCHGKNAAGQDGVAPPFVHRIYEPNHHGDGSFLVAALSGVRAHHWPFGDMPPVEGVEEADVTKIVEYVRALQRANGIQ